MTPEEYLALLQEEDPDAHEVSMGDLRIFVTDLVAPNVVWGVHLDHLIFLPTRGDA